MSSVIGSSTYLRLEIVRLFRNWRFFLFSLGFPLILYLLLAGPNRDKHFQGIPVPVYYMVGMVAWGSMTAVMAGGGRIAAERAAGWNRQLRLTPLRESTYLATKVLAGYVMAFCSMILLAVAGTSVGVRLSLRGWVTLIGLVVVGLVPFATLGIALGHLVSVDAMGPAMGGVTALLALLGGAWGPIAENGWLHDLVEWLPSYWLVRAGRAAFGAGGWPPKAWIVIAVWTVVLVRVGQRAYARDTRRA